MLHHTSAPYLQARRLLIDINRLGLPVACEYIDTISPQFIADLVSWSGNDARTVESPLHCELSSGLSTPVGFKNGSSGDSSAAIEAVSASAGPHAFLSVSKQGVAGIVETSGNRDCHVVLHGGTGGPNHSEEAVRGVCNSLAALQLPARVMVDCGSYNARQSPSVQAEVAEGMAARIAKGDECVFGLVLHSFLVSGRQDVVAGGAPVYGMSVTEPCLDWSATSAILQKLAAAVRQRRAASQSAAVASAASANGVERSLSFAELGEIDTDNLRVRMIRPLRPPACLIEELESDVAVRQQVMQARCDISSVLYGGLDKLVVVVGPSTVHDPRAAMEFAARLRTAAQACAQELVVVMNVNFETSASAAGWKGLINDPDLDGSCQINKGFRQARQLLLDINRLGLPTSTEYVAICYP